ncbi:MAG TPA: hypothetical protein VFG00_10705 [Acidothermaceae bacterium]|nr:hypothetical protein [Acidothermaceae bacterium]
MTTKSDAVVDPAVPRFRWASPGSAVVVAVITIVLLVVGVPLSEMAKQGLVNQDILMLPFAIVGFIVARKQPRNPIGWVMLALAPIFELSADAGMYSVIIYHLGHPTLPLGRLAVALTQLWVALLVLLPVPIMLFPDGRLESRRWRWAFWLYAVVCTLILISTAIADVGAFTDRHIQVDSTGELTAYKQNASHNLAAVLFPVYAVLALAFVIRQLVAYRRAKAERREQLKWLMAGGTIGIVAIATTLSIGAGFGFVGIIAVPVGIGIGILKYRLYDIDRLISRTLSYAIVTGLLVGIYIGLVTLATRALPLSSPIGVAASTLTVAALFSPLRRRAQHLVDRRFNRARYDADATIAAFAARLRDEVDLERVQHDLLDVVRRSVEPSHAAVWVRSAS